LRVDGPNEGLGEGGSGMRGRGQYTNKKKKKTKKQKKKKKKKKKNKQGEEGKRGTSGRHTNESQPGAHPQKTSITRGWRSTINSGVLTGRPAILNRPVRDSEGGGRTRSKNPTMKMNDISH